MGFVVRNAGVTVDLAAVVVDCAATAAAAAVEESHKKNVWNNFDVSLDLIIVLVDD